ncbi:hypothetical protein Pmani_026148 [Petrolisthes manimaculis]|uniref:Protein kinase domain-containing protein n=1 Tax=Petrolisthes manimaculis TaxID=1843537 RepID=A0AAE1TXQ1_9EUCA|nr:hypothetical protein Pmani_026148 [Petrolisthes manimaculis]
MTRSSDLYLEEERISTEARGRQLLQDECLELKDGKLLQISKPGDDIVDKDSWWLKVFLSVTKNVMDIHALGCTHNDLHGINIILSTKEDKDSPVTYLLDFGLAVMEDWGHTDEEEQLKRNAPELDIRSLGYLLKGLILYHIKTSTSSHKELWEGGLHELVNAMYNIDLTKVPPLSYVYQELSRLLRLSMERQQLSLQPLNITHQPTTSTSPSLIPIYTEKGMRVARYLSFPLTPPRPLTCSKMSGDDVKHYKYKSKVK